MPQSASSCTPMETAAIGCIARKCRRTAYLNADAFLASMHNVGAHQECVQVLQFKSGLCKPQQSIYLPQSGAGAGEYAQLEPCQIWQVLLSLHFVHTFSHSPRCASCREAQLEPMLTNASFASSEGSDTYLLAKHSSRARASSGQASVPENPFDGLCSQSFGSQEPAPAPSGPYVPCSLAHIAVADLSRMSYVSSRSHIAIHTS